MLFQSGVGAFDPQVLQFANTRFSRSRSESLYSSVLNSVFESTRSITT